jgi:chemotaxis protein
LPSAFAAVEEPAAELAVEEAVELEEPPQAARPRAAADAPATFRKLRREIIFFIVVLLLLLVNICHRPQHEDGS